MSKSIFSCLKHQHKILTKNSERLLSYYSKIAKKYPKLKRKYKFKDLFIVNHETKFFQSVSVVTKKEKWINIEKFDENFSDGEAFGIWDFEFEIQTHPQPYLMWSEMSSKLNEILTLWFLENAAKSELSNLKEDVFYSSNGHFEEIWNLKNWEGPVDIDQIDTIRTK